MFNKSYNQVSAECAALNGKLRGHVGGKLNSPARVVQLQVDNSGQNGIFFLKNLMICTALIAFYFLIKGLFSR